MASEAPKAQPVSAAPAEWQCISHNGKEYTIVKEGLAYILVPKPALDAAKQSNDSEGVQNVFYNPIQQFNRDLTVLAIKAYGEERMQLKEAAFQKKIQSLRQKKRKRQDQKLGDERSAKAPKLSDDQPVVESKPKEEATGSEPADAKAEQNTSVEADPAVTALGQTAVPEPSTTSNGDSATKTDEKPSRPPPSFKILDALSATGLRAIRYSKEIPFVTSVTSNDLLAEAVESIKLNVEHNELQSKVNVSHDDAIAYMYTLVAQEMRKQNAQRHPDPAKSNRYDVVDLDPYGTAAPFLDAAVQAVRDDGGLLCVTCTDSGVWASNGYPEKAYSLYGGIPLKGGQHSHEVGLRLILHAIESAAAKYGLAMEPLLSLSIDFYVRVFVRIRKSPASVKFQAGKSMIAYNCDNGCGAWATQMLAKNKSAPNKKGGGTFYKHVMASGPPSDRNCAHCGSLMHLSGPMYGGRLHSPDFVKRVLSEVSAAPRAVYATLDRVEGMLQTALEEYLPTPEEAEAQEALQKIEAEPEAEDYEAQKSKALAKLKDLSLAAYDPYPFFFLPAYIAGRMHCITPPEDPLKGALIGLGYRVTRSHCKRGSIKTDASWPVIWRVMREWVRQRCPVKEENIKESSPAYRLLRLHKKENDDSKSAKEDAVENEVDKLEVVFDAKLGQDPDKAKYVRYQINPRENWGPMARAKGK
ncbi:N2,N2-dimethylguanosine tRNA methyltransferase [Coniochaeta ligniaria NRRL 30616]|uniref:tRNA (guanine(26)-N(2))-dimethyltransferase n=1 Tax=Coniochaeta ligniaria NRRL 30616 TaxID=1408157 RepID=A0A1J7IXG4_9PEZI|nr:N2,N2-dimethylguanosine tRNA methyltransferase [Coniochaeta ligniaria NRRL 30616]